MKENETALRDMSMGDVIDYTIQVYRRNFIKITLLSLIFYVPFTLIYGFISNYLTADMMDLFGYYDKQPDLEALNNLGFTVAAYYLSLFGLSLLYGAYTLTLKPVLDAAIAGIIYNDVVFKKQVSIGDAVKEAFKKFGTLFLNKLLYGCIVVCVGVGAITIVYILLIAYIIAAAVLFTAGSATGTVSEGLLIFLIIVSVIFFIAVIAAMIVLVAYFMAKYGMGIQAVIIENKGAVAGISRCNVLAKKSFWFVNLSYIFAMMLFFAIPTLIQTAAAMLVYVDKNLFNYASTGTQVLGAVFYPFSVVIITMLFIALKIKKEGLDLEVKVDVLLEEQKARESEANGN